MRFLILLVFTNVLFDVSQDFRSLSGQRHCDVPSLSDLGQCYPLYSHHIYIIYSDDQIFLIMIYFPSLLSTYVVEYNVFFLPSWSVFPILVQNAFNLLILPA